MLPRKRQKPRMGVRDEPREFPQHCKWVRLSHACACDGKGGCEGRMEAHHVRENTGGGTGLRPPDWWTIPLCARHHKECHDRGWKTFEAKYGFSMREMAESLARVSPHRWRWMEVA